MAALKKADEKKWINGALLVGAVLIGYVFFAFLETMADWFELESKVPQWSKVSQLLSIVVALGSFLFVSKYQTTASFISETFNELVKVVWPEGAGTARKSVGIIIGVTIVGIFLGILDFSISQLLTLIHGM